MPAQWVKALPPTAAMCLTNVPDHFGAIQI
jgi:hypothetical protein